MIRRACVVLAMAILGCLMLSTPAHAKGPSSATVSGPGMEPQTVKWQYRPGSTRPNLDELTAATGLHHAWVRGRTGKPTAPEGELGPRFTVVYHFGGESLRQDLYPLASTGGLVFTPPQRATGQRIPAGWREAGSGLDTILSELGADLDRAAASTVDQAAPADDEDATAGGWLVPWGLVAVLAGGLVAASAVRLWLTSRPRRPATG